MTSTKKLRLDKLLTERKLVGSRERAQAIILAGKVLVDEQKIEKPGTAVSPKARIRLLDAAPRYVSRGGQKLEAAISHWNIAVGGRVCMDVGASTGGFTDCLLQHGAAQVIAIDTGYGQMVARLRSHPLVRLLERTNARYLTTGQVAQPVDLLVMDVSFISATLVLPAVVAAASPRELVVLVKPQFEAGRGRVGKGGIVRDPATQMAAIEKVKSTVQQLGGTELDVRDSPISGAEGNREFLLHADFKDHNAQRQVLENFDSPTVKLSRDITKKQTTKDTKTARRYRLIPS